MRVLPPGRELFCYLIFCSCSLLLMFMYNFQGQELPTQRLITNASEAIQFSKYTQENNKTNNYDYVRKNLEPTFSKYTTILKNENSDEDSEKFRNDIDYSILLEGIKVGSTVMSSQSHFFQNISSNVLVKPNEIDASPLNINYTWKAIQNEEAVMILSDILDKKLNISLIRKIEEFKPTCENDLKLANSCDNKKCLQTELPKDLTTRVEQLVTNSKLQMSHDDHVILNEMAESVSGNYDIILLTAASSNHFLESQALLKNLHENVYPYLKNFTLIFYNLGLTEPERKLMVKYCKCQVKDFPFDKFPQFMTLLKCYSWKPVLIKSHLQKANIVFWIDVSVRFHNSSENLNKCIQTTRERGLQIGGSSADSTFRTDRAMYHFFGDEPCAYLSLGQAAATFGVYHREYLVDRAILEPWVACALNNDCMCLKDKTNISCGASNRAAKRYHEDNGPIIYGLCHRFDQSAISLILHKLYQEKNSWVMVNINPVVKFRREDKLSYFPKHLFNT